MADDRVEERRPVPGLDRIVFFSDAVMAIAITLIVVQINVPDVLGPNIGEALSEKWREYLSFLLSFWVIGLYWSWHHTMFRAIVRYDDRFIWLNLLFLMCVAFLPFPTAVLGEYGGEGPAVMAYAATITVTGITSALLWGYATRNHRLVVGDLTGESIAYYRRNSLVAPSVFALSIPIAAVNADAAKYFWILAFVIPRVMAHTRWGRVPENDVLRPRN